MTHYPERRDVYSLAWSPDGNRIAYTEAYYDLKKQDSGEPWVVTLRTVRPDGSGMRALPTKESSPDAPQRKPWPRGTRVKGW